MIAAGFGFRSICTAEDLYQALQKVCESYQIPLEYISILATSTMKQEDPILVDLNQRLKKKILYFSYSDLTHISDRLKTHSAISLKVSGSPCLSEAAALCAAGANSYLLGPRIIQNNVTCALAMKGKTS